MTNLPLFLIWFSATSLEEKLLWFSSSDAIELLKNVPQSWYADVNPQVDSWVLRWQEAVGEDNINRLPGYLQENKIRQLVSNYFVIKRLINHNLNNNIINLLNPLQSEWLTLLKSVLENVSNMGGISEVRKEDFCPDIQLCKEINRGYIYAPFLREVRLILENELTILSSSTGLIVEQQKIINYTLKNLAKKCDLITSRSLSQQFSLFKSLNLILGNNSEEKYQNFFNTYFFTPSGYVEFFKKFPVLARIIAQYSYQTIYTFRLLVARLSQDWSEIANYFFYKHIPNKLVNIETDLSDPHNQGLTVIILEFNLGKKLVYKPKNLKIAEKFQKLLYFLNQRGKTEFPILKIWVKKYYGYVEYVSHYADCENAQGASRFYKQMGGYLAILKLLSGTDMHSENLIAFGKKCYLIDLETLLTPKQRVAHTLSSIFNNSLLNTGFLRCPITPDLTGINSEDSSGLLAGEPDTLFFETRKIVNDGTDLIDVVQSQEVNSLYNIDSNRIKILGEIVNPSDFRDCIEDGFAEVCCILNRNSLEIINSFEFNDSIVNRYVLRSTLYYDLLTFKSQKGLFLQNSLYVDLVLARLWRMFKASVYEPIIRSEIRQIWNQDIPFFTSHPNSRYLYDGNGNQLSDIFIHTAWEELKERIQQIQDNGIIAAEQSLIRVGVPTKLEMEKALWDIPDMNALSTASQIGEFLIRDTYNNREGCNRYVNGSLYRGSAGISLFLTYLAELTGDSKYRVAAEQAFQHTCTNTNLKLVGVFNGIGGLIYLFVTLYSLSKETFYLKQAVNHLSTLKKLIITEKKIDIISGISGLIPVLIGLANAGVHEALDLAALCGEHILQIVCFENNQLTGSKPAISKKNIGFSHGASGIGWALIKLGNVLGQEHFIKAGIALFASENSFLNYYEENCSNCYINILKHQYITNSWCYGSPGIALARFQSWQILGKKDWELKHQAETALMDTLNTIEEVSARFLNLCNGGSGNCEIMTEISILTKQPVILAKARALGAKWSIRYSKNHSWPGVTGKYINPSLMSGLAGIGMLYLRLAYPRCIPSVLALALLE